MEEEEAEIEETAGNRPAVDEDVFFHQMPAPGTHDEGGDAIGQAVGFSFRTPELDGAGDRVPEVDLPLDGAVPSWGMGILEIGHIS